MSIVMISKLHMSKNVSANELREDVARSIASFIKRLALATSETERMQICDAMARYLNDCFDLVKDDLSGRTRAAVAAHVLLWEDYLPKGGNRNNKNKQLRTRTGSIVSNASNGSNNGSNNGVTNGASNSATTGKETNNKGFLESLTDALGFKSNSVSAENTGAPAAAAATASSNKVDVMNPLMMNSTNQKGGAKRGRTMSSRRKTRSRSASSHKRRGGAAKMSAKKKTTHRKKKA